MHTTDLTLRDPGRPRTPHRTRRHPGPVALAMLLTLALLTACADAPAGDAETAPPQEETSPGQEEAAAAAPSYLSLLLEENGVRLELLEVPSFETGERRLLLRMINEGEREYYAELGDLRLDSRIRVDADTSVSCEPGKARTVSWDPLQAAVVSALQAGESADRLTCTVTLTTWDDSLDYEERSHSYSCDVPLPACGGEPVFEEVYAMRADRQVITETENLRVTLLGCGEVPAAGLSGTLQGLLLVENTGRVPVPFMVNGLLLNGMFVEVYQTGSSKVPAGLSQYVRFNAYGDKLEESGVSLISDMELLLLTDEKEDTGTVNMAGGSWYPVELAVHADEAQTFEEGDLLYEDEYVRVGLRSAESTWTELEYADSFGSCEWVLAVTNKSDRNLELSASDYTYEAFDPGEHTPYIGDGDVGAGARRYVVLRLNIDEPVPLPAISFRLQVRTAGGGRLLAYPEEKLAVAGEP